MSFAAGENSPEGIPQIPRGDSLSASFFTFGFSKAIFLTLPGNSSRVHKRRDKRFSFFLFVVALSSKLIVHGSWLMRVNNELSRSLARVGSRVAMKVICSRARAEGIRVKNWRRFAIFRKIDFPHFQFVNLRISIVIEILAQKISANSFDFVSRVTLKGLESLKGL